MSLAPVNGSHNGLNHGFVLDGAEELEHHVLKTALGSVDVSILKLGLGTNPNFRLPHARISLFHSPDKAPIQVFSPYHFCHSNFFVQEDEFLTLIGVKAFPMVRFRDPIENFICGFFNNGSEIKGIPLNALRLETWKLPEGTLLKSADKVHLFSSGKGGVRLGHSLLERVRLCSQTKGNLPVGHFTLDDVFSIRLGKSTKVGDKKGWMYVCKKSGVVQKDVIANFFKKK